MPAMEADPPPGDGLLPIALLIDELRSEDGATRAAAMTRLPDIAAALGPARARDELLPFVGESVDDDDEVILVLANKLGGAMVPLVGGPEHAVALLPALEALAAVEEGAVRDAVSGWRGERRKRAAREAREAITG